MISSENQYDVQRMNITNHSNPIIMDSITLSMLGIRVESDFVGSEGHSLITESMTSTDCSDFCETLDRSSSMRRPHLRDDHPVIIGCGVQFPHGIAYEFKRQHHRGFFQRCRQCIRDVCKRQKLNFLHQPEF